MSNVINASGRFSLLHPKIGARVTIKRMGWFHKWMFYGRKSHQGEKGIVISVERGQLSKENLYSVLFGGENWSTSETMVYFEQDLEFTTLGICELKRRPA